jgi:hypothetical protein
VRDRFQGIQYTALGGPFWNLYELKVTDWIGKYSNWKLTFSLLSLPERAVLKQGINFCRKFL